MAKDNFATRIIISAKDEASGVFNLVRRNAGKVATAIVGYFSGRFFMGAIKEAEELDVQMRKLEGVIEATGGAAGLTAQEIDEMARRLDEATTGSAAGFRDAAAQLLTFKSVGKDAFETTLMLAQDLADAGFGSVTSNAVQLGKALEDPVKGLSALTRSGVSFTQEQQKVIKTLVETGRQAEAQAIILNAVAGQVGGVASAIGGGLSGAVDLASKRFTELRQQLGQAVLPVFERFYLRLAEFFERLRDSDVITRFGEIVAKAFEGAQEAVFNFLDSFDLDAFLVQLRSWADTTKDTVETWVSQLKRASDAATLSFNIMGAGFNTIRATILGFGGVVTKVMHTVVDGIGYGMSLLGVFSKTAREVSDEIRFMAGGLNEVSQAMFEEAGNALTAATENANAAQEAYANLTSSQNEAAESAGNLASTLSDVVTSEENLATQTGITASQLDALGESADFMADSAESAATAIDATTAAAKRSIEELLEAEVATQVLKDAYEELGITSQAALDEAAENAKTAFETIKNSGQATARELQQAFQTYAQRAIEANNGIATHALKAEAAQYGLKIEADETGKVIVKAMDAAAKATEKVGSAADDAAKAYKRLAKAAKDADDKKDDKDDEDNKGSKSRSGGTFRAGRFSMSELQALDPKLAQQAAEAIADLNRNFASDGSSTYYRKSQYETAMRRIEQAAAAIESSQKQQKQESQQSREQSREQVSSLDEISKAMEQALAKAIPQAQQASKKVELTLNLPGNIKTTGMFDESEADRLMRELNSMARISR